MSKMVNTQPKGLFTSLVLFITLGLFSLATLFTVLILEVRSGQQQLNQQLKTLTGVPLPTPQVIAENNLSPLPGDQFNRLLATVDLIATRQRSSNVNVLLQQLEQIDSKMELIQQSVSHNKTPTEVPQLSKIEQAITAQQLQLEGLLQGQQQQATQNQAIDKKLQQVSYPAPLPAPIDLSTVENQLEHLQQQVTQLAERPDTSRAIQQQLKQLVKQQRGLKQSQQQLQESVMQNSSAAVDPTTASDGA